MLHSMMTVQKKSDFVNLKSPPTIMLLLLLRSLVICKRTTPLSSTSCTLSDDTLQYHLGCPKSQRLINLDAVSLSKLMLHDSLTF